MPVWIKQTIVSSFEIFFAYYIFTVIILDKGMKQLRMRKFKYSMLCIKKKKKKEDCWINVYKKLIDSERHIFRQVLALNTSVNDFIYKAATNFMTQCYWLNWNIGIKNQIKFVVLWKIKLYV